MTKKQISKLVAFPSLVIIILTLLDIAVLGKETASEDSVKNFAREEKNSLDAMFVGSSTVWHGIIPTELYTETGLTSRVIGKTPFHTGLIPDLLEYIYRYQTPQVVYIDYTACFNPYVVDDSSFNSFLEDFYKCVPTDEDKQVLLDKYEYLQKFTETKTLDEILFPYHNNFRRVDWWTNLNLTDMNFTKGFYAQNAILQKLTKIDIPESEPIDIRENNDDAFRYINNILDFCDKHTETRFIFARTTRQLCDETEAKTDTFSFEWVKNYIQDYRVNGNSELNIEKNENARNDYIVEDFALLADDIGIDESTDQRDAGHLNVNGARKFTKYLSSYLLKNVTLNINHTEDVNKDFTDSAKKTEEYLESILKSGLIH